MNTSSKLLWQGRFLKISLVEGHYEVVNRPHAVAIIALDDSGNILLVKQYRPAIGKEILEIPAGLVEEGEHPVDTAIRELKEETGYFPIENSTEYLGYMYPTVGYSDEVIHFVKLKVDKSRYTGQDLGEGEKINDIIFVPIDDFIGMAKRLEIHDGKTLVAALLVVY